MLDNSPQKFFVKLIKKISKVENFLKFDIMHFRTEFAHISIGLSLLLKLELYLFLLYQLLINLSFWLHWVDIVNDCVVHFFVILLSGLSKFDFKANDCLTGDIVIVRADLRCKPLSFKIREQWFLALMPQYMSDVFIDMFFVDVFKFLYGPEEFHDCFLLDWLHSNKFSQILCLERQIILIFRKIFVNNFVEKWNKLLFHFFNWQIRTQNCVNPVSTILGFIELN